MPDEVWLNDGSGHFEITDQTLGMESSYDVALGDVDNDGDLDAVTAACGDVGPDNNNQLWINDGTGYFTNSGQYFGSECTSAVALGDVDASGSLDIVFANAGSDHGIQIWQNDATGVFSLTQTLDRDYNFDVALKDLDGDTDLDLFVANGQAMYAVAPDTVWINDGTGVFTDTGQRLGSETGNAVAVADLDLDGDLDAFVGNGAPDWPLKSVRPAWEWLGAPAAITPEGSFAQSNIVWLNDGHAVFEDANEPLETFYTLDVALGDLDGDGDVDAFVGNSGPPNQVLLNNKLQPAIALPRLWLPMIVR
jgi:hypothetical protein